MNICTTYLGDLICLGENPRKMTLLSYSFDTYIKNKLHLSIFSYLTVNNKSP